MEGKDSVGLDFCGNQRRQATKLYFHSPPGEEDSIVFCGIATSCILKSEFDPILFAPMKC